ASAMDPPSRIEDAAETERTYARQARTPFNVTGHPALAMMAGLSAAGLPLSVQFVARYFGEGMLFQVAPAWDRAAGTAERHPTIGWAGSRRRDYYDHLCAEARNQDFARMRRQLHLNLFIHSRGHHEASWRHPDSSPLSLTDIRYYQDLAQRAEAALFDSIFFADQLALGGDVTQAPRTWLEPITVLAALAVSTKRIGLIATASTTYTEPFNLARQFASIDHISNGRAAWNIVTSWLATAAENYGGDGQVSHADRYARGEEFMAVVKELWDSWGADAVIDERASGRYAHGERIRPINHRGEH